MIRERPELLSKRFESFSRLVIPLLESEHIKGYPIASRDWQPTFTDLASELGVSRDRALRTLNVVDVAVRSEGQVGVSSKCVYRVQGT